MNDETPVRIYANLRSAHLERLPDMVPALMWYSATRDDFDPELIDPSRAPERLSRREILRRLARGRYPVVEVAEPAMTGQWAFLLPQLLVLRLGRLLRRNDTIVTTYCIHNADPVPEAQVRWRLPSWLARPVVWLGLRLAVASIDRIAFGTDGSRSTYERIVGKEALSAARTFEGIPGRCDCLGADERDADRVIFVGSFVERKGIVPLMSMWEQVHERRPEARLTLLGKGSLRAEVEAWARDRSDVDLEIDPPRARIHEALRTSGVLVLLSQRRGFWREQIGLPILEGLGHGCEIVATTETGIAGWLVSHDHEVVDPLAPPSAVADAVEAAMERVAERRGSLGDLPASDRRRAADHWMMTGLEA